VAKRSPILGYNHNVRYRGLVFHVQTEDSGILSPHMFTHLFHAGVIVSTRKLVYDAGSAEDSIKSLMQAQHKAVLKDLKRGHFDDKIDAYLTGTPGLLPRGTDESANANGTAGESRLARASEPSVAAPDPPAEAEALATAAPVAPIEDDIAFKPTKRAVTPPIDESPPARPRALTGDRTLPVPQQRTQTAERTSGSVTIRTPPPSVARTQSEEAGRTIHDPSLAAAMATTRTPVPRDFADSGPEIEIQLELDDPDEQPQRARMSRDTDLALPPRYDDHTRPTVDVSQLDSLPPIPPNMRMPGESIPPLPPPPARPSTAVGASALPPARPITRPPARPAITPPQVVSRPLGPEDGRRRESDAVEVYAPAPPSADPPPNMAERPGQYAQHKKSGRIPVDAVKGAPPAPAVPAGLGRPGRPATPPIGTPPRTVQPPQMPAPDRQAFAARPTEPPQPRTRPPTPPRSIIVGGAPRPPASSPTPSGGGVVMTRPAVIVGAPAKPSSPPRVRKAREDEGRGFGQGLISEKSLDEVILAYLSEDSDDK
jgi:hypothetical protein